ncbi:uncharacterized protein QC763_0082600 [Podospora pseudopauciseta]|uniref:Monooxygenase n=1 Tax=Podospora pseudopauciseta TaxID=2093780 RepID=A0ABR0H8D5_9PEZI|nr:hypothetical protein QC763_0082600 [Podospora pseudopauciseta]
MSSDKETEVPFTQFACIGTGFSGIALGATIQRWYSISPSSIQFFDSQPCVGGTWSINQYPGAACDVPSALYSFSFERNPNWTRFLPPHDELRAYLTKVAEKYNLVPRMKFNTKVTKAEWIPSPTNPRWRLTILDLETNLTSHHECQFLFSGSGQFNSPRPLDVPGIDSFQGPVIHSARWDHSVSLHDKKVVVFGNGCTAAQIVPSILSSTAHLTQIVRSKHWIYPPVDAKVSPFAKKLLASMPGATLLQRFIVYHLAEADWAGFTLTPSAASFRSRRRKMAEKYMKTTAPQKYHPLLVPEFEIGCKRRVFDSGYLECLHSEKITLTNDKAVEILPHGVKMADGRVVEADVLVLANGFETNTPTTLLPVVGTGGHTLQEHWSETFPGPEAYNCTSLHGFPNFFLLWGPNTATGHTSAVMAIENGVNFALRVIKPCLEGRASVVDVTEQAEREFVERAQEALGKTVFTSETCNSWYTARDRETGRVWNGMTYPWSQARYWWDCMMIKKGDWVYSQVEYRQEEEARIVVHRFRRDGLGLAACLGWKEPEFSFGAGIGWVKVCCCCACSEDMGIGCDRTKGAELIVQTILFTHIAVCTILHINHDPPSVGHVSNHRYSCTYFTTSKALSQQPARP